LRILGGERAMSKGNGFKIAIVQNGPYLVSGGVPLAKQHIVPNEEGESIEWREGHRYPPDASYALCRCGQSRNKPFCDGTHKKVRFDGSETASREPHREQAEVIEGPTMSLADAESLCAFARFCDPAGKVWNLVGRTDHEDARRLVEHEAGHCPSGRLVAIDRKTGEALEPRFDPSIGVIEDTAKAISGPLWIRGGIPITSGDGTEYEVRNRVTLCRCGASSNRPFCDGSHASIGFTDER
jgi:CDGSH-type Zn-finger protein